MHCRGLRGSLSSASGNCHPLPDLRRGRPGLLHVCPDWRPASMNRRVVCEFNQTAKKPIGGTEAEEKEAEEKHDRFDLYRYSQAGWRRISLKSSRTRMQPRRGFKRE